ncbi:MAG: FAD:protein FMN transferase [Clostridiales bacterium]|nr:FAD:protein FMN transferase [Clostridiales bacterium]
MDTVMELTVYGSDDVLSKAEDLISSLEKNLSVTDESSEIYAVNQNGGGRVGDDTRDLIAQSLTLCERTGGALDISVYPVVRAWGFTTGEYRVPSGDEITELLTFVDYNAVTISADNTVSLKRGMKIDLGSVAKGYTGDRLAELLTENGVASATLNLGGNVHALGAKPDGSPWKIAITNPLGAGTAGAIQVTDKAVVTSGGYERFFEENGTTYRHIIDPATGYPVDNDLASVSVIGDTGLVCDALSTSLFVMGLDHAIDFWKGSSDFDAVFITTAGQIYITEGLEETFVPLGDYKEADVTVIRHD